MGTYNTDFYKWTQEQAALLRAGDVAKLDVPNLLEEVEALGRGERRNIVSGLSTLMCHLIKWKWQSGKNYGPNWRNAICEQRLRVSLIMEDNRGFRSNLPEFIASGWKGARRLASKDIGISEKYFPEKCPWDWEELLDHDYYPEPD